MDDYLCFLVAVLYNDGLLWCALKIDKWDLPEGTIDSVWDNPNAEESRDIIHDLLPLHVRNCGPVVEVKRLFDIHIHTRKAQTGDHQGV